MKTIFKATFILAFLFLITPAFSQIGVGYFGGDANKVALNIDFHEKIWTSLRLSSSYPLYNQYDNWGGYSDDDFVTEVLIGLDLYTSDIVDCSISLAWTMEWSDIYYGFGLPIGVKIKPFENARNFAFRIESSPYLDDSVEFKWLNYWGISIDF